MAHKVTFINCYGCNKPRALRVDRWPFCTLCRLMGDEDRWYKQYVPRYMTGGKSDIKGVS